MNAAVSRADNDIITLHSAHGVSATMDRLSSLIAAKGLRVFVRINHAAAGAEAHLKLRPTEVLVFGHPAKGTLLMQERQIVGLDLPLRVLAWQDEAGRVWLSYRHLASIAGWHGLAGPSAEAVSAIDANLAQLCAAAAGGTGPTRTD